MKKTLVLGLALAASLPALAGGNEFSILVDRQTPHDISSNGTTYSTDKQTGYALRYGHDVAHLGSATLEFNATWHPRNSGGDLFGNGQNVNNGTTTYKVRNEYLGAGADLNWHQVVDFGFGAELRNETTALHIEDNTGAVANLTGSFSRFWVKGHVGYTFDTASTKPFVALELALPTAKKQNDLNGGTAIYDLAQDLNPKFQAALNLGVRF